MVLLKSDLRIYRNNLEDIELKTFKNKKTTICSTLLINKKVVWISCCELCMPISKYRVPLKSHSL